MEVKELMIGDWVCYIPEIEVGEDSYLGEPQNVQVDLGCLQRVDELIFAPIPLTEEILKANADGGSCSFDEFRSLYHLKCNGYHQEICIEFDKSWYEPFVEITGMGRTTIKVNMQYVHELQHALRLCGRNDLADNFKV